MFKRYRSWLFKYFPFIILLILAFTYRDVIRNMVLVPLAYLIFIFRLISSSIGQQTLWISFVILSTIVAIISLTKRRVHTHAEHTTEHKYPSRLKVWIDILSRKDQSPYFQWNMAREISDLYIEAIAHRDGMSPEKVKQQIQLGYIDLPPDILEYLEISQKRFGQSGLHRPYSRNRLIQIWENIVKSATSDVKRSPLDIDNKKIIHHLEKTFRIDSEIWDR